MANKWVEVCRVGRDFRPTHGTVAAVAEAVRRGADLRRFSTYSPQTTGLVEETMTLQTTWVFDDEHVGGLATLRQPVHCALDFNFGSCMAYWIFNVAAPSAVTFIPLDGKAVDQATGNWIRVENHPFTKGSDVEWFSPEYRWWANNDWEEIYAHDEQGHAVHGSWQDIQHAANNGCVLKVGIRNLWEYLTPSGQVSPEHEVFIECGVQFVHIDSQFSGVLTIPTLMLGPCKPLKFVGETFAPGWLLVRTDGRLCRQTLEPSTMQWQRTWARHAIRWFAR